MFLEGLEDDDLAILRQGFETMVILLLRELWRVAFPSCCIQNLLKVESATNVNVVLKTCGKFDLFMMFVDYVLELRKQNLRYCM